MQTETITQTSSQHAEVVIPFARPFYPLLKEPSSHRIIIYHGGRGGGKSVHFALALLGKAREHKIRVLCTREIQRTIRDSVHKLLSDIINKYEFNDFEIIRESIINKLTGSEFIFKGLKNNPSEIKSTEGIDICWVEEAHAVSRESLDFLQPTIRREGSQIWFSFNRFYDNDAVWSKYCQNPDDRTLIIKVNYWDNPYFPNVLRQDMLKDKETDYESYLHIWEGEPLGQEATAILPRSWVIKAAQRNILNPKGGKRIGADIARFGPDKIQFYKKHGLKTIEGQTYRKLKITQTADHLMDFADNKRIQINVDDTGMGGGVTDILSDNSYNVTPINFGGKPKNDDLYRNVASEMWFEFRDLLEKEEVDIPNDNELIEELCGRLYSYDSRQRKIVEPKDHFKKRFGRSPDKADSILMTYYDAEGGNLNFGWV